MGVHVLPEELAKQWSLSFAEVEFVNAKPAAIRLGLAAQLKFFAAYGFFVAAATDIPDEAATYLAEQLGVSNSDLLGYDFRGARDGATARKSRAISAFVG
jgi:TnpA family transposase